MAKISHRQPPSGPKILSKYEVVHVLAEPAVSPHVTFVLEVDVEMRDVAIINLVSTPPDTPGIVIGAPTIPERGYLLVPIHNTLDGFPMPSGEYVFTVCRIQF